MGPIGKLVGHPSNQVGRKGRDSALRAGSQRSEERTHKDRRGERAQDTPHAATSLSTRAWYPPSRASNPPARACVGPGRTSES